MFTALIVGGCLIALVIYAQVGWMVGRHWSPGESFDDLMMSIMLTAFWPVAIVVRYGIWPPLVLFARLVGWPQRLLAARKKAKAEREDQEMRRKWKEEDEARARAAAEAESPVAKISKINDDLLRLDAQRAELLARKAELERRPDAARA